MPYDVPGMLAALQDAAPETRLSAAYALEQALKQELESGRTDWAPLVADLLPRLIASVGDEHKGVQVHSANCLEFLAFQSDAVVPALREAMAGPDAWKAWGTALVAARMGYWFPEMAPALGNAMGARDRDVRWAAAGFSLQLGRSHPEAVANVKATLRSENANARKMAAYCLGAMGQYADVEEALAGALDDPERDVRRAVILGLDKLPRISAPVQERIATMRQDPDEYVRRTAAAVAAKFGK
ncbi:MAG TPA: HEAT repeat domain-containing protein [Symbiobacteriaceae bacterium]|jgi:HEAT repeat protein|nr:HEAT repeat domain-containing protein [Symbiobacteriaceae bacterium]